MPKATMKRRQFQLTIGGKRRLFSLGECEESKLRNYKRHIEELLRANRDDELPHKTTRAWAAKVDDKFHARLAEFGLAEPRTARSGPLTLKAFLDDYLNTKRELDGKHKLKPRTLIGYEQDADSLVSHFGAKRVLSSIIEGDADKFVAWLQSKGSKSGKGFAKATIGRRLRRCKEFFRAAARQGLIAKNPFDGIKGFSQDNDSRYQFVPREAIDKLLNVATDIEWKLIIALARYGGIRTPSETFALTWDCIDWEGERIRVNSPKTEHHEGGAYRIIPMFPELRPLMEQAFDAAPEGSQYVIRRMRHGAGNLRTQILRLIARAGLKPWPRVFHNLRASRQNELLDEGHNLHVVCDWIGNSPDIAYKHYLHVHQKDFDKATGKATVQGTVQDGSKAGGIRNNPVPSEAIFSAFSRLLFPSGNAVSNVIPSEKTGTFRKSIDYPRQEENISNGVQESIETGDAERAGNCAVDSGAALVTLIQSLDPEARQQIVLVLLKAATTGQVEAQPFPVGCV